MSPADTSLYRAVKLVKFLVDQHGATKAKCCEHLSISRESLDELIQDLQTVCQVRIVEEERFGMCYVSYFGIFNKHHIES